MKRDGKRLGVKDMKIQKVGNALILIVLLTMVFTPPKTSASSSSFYWVKEYGDGGSEVVTSILATPDGGFIVVGHTDSWGAGNQDILVFRIDKNGNIKWQKTFGGSGYDWASDAVVTSEGDIIIAGHTNSFGANGYSDVWVLKLDGNGNVKWQKTYGGSNNDWAESVAIAENGDVIVAGETYSFGADGLGVWILRLDENGNIKWQKVYENEKIHHISAVKVTPDGDIVVVGGIRNSDTKMDLLIIKLDEYGNIKWVKTYGGFNEDSFIEADLIVLPSGDLIVASGSASFGIGYEVDYEDGRTIALDLWVLKIDKDGNIEWQKAYGTIGEPSGIILDQFTNNVAIIQGLRNVIIIDTDGNIVRQQKYIPMGIPIFESITILENDIIIGGSMSAYSQSDQAWGDDNALILKLPFTLNLPDCSFCTDVDLNIENTNAIVRNADLQVIGTNCFVLSPNNVVITTPNLEVKTLYQNWGTLRVSSIPSQASIYINGEYRGETPLTLEVEAGTYAIRISKADYHDYITTVTVESREIKTINAELTPAFGYLTIESSPSGAEVYVDGSYKGTTPITLELSPGGHKVKIKKEGYEDYTKTVTIEAGKSVSVSARLVAIPISQETSPERQQPSPTTSESTHTTTVQTGYQEPTGSGRLNRTMVYLVLIALALLISLSVIKRKRREVSIKFGKLTFSIVEGNIIHFPAEGIVNSVDKYLSYKGGVSRHVAKAAVGDVNKYREISRATMKKQIGRDWIRHGEVVVTPPFRLKRNGVKYVINTFGPDCKARWNKELEEILKLSIIAALRKADELGVERVAFPPIRAGASGCPFKHVVKTFLESVEEFSKEAKNIKEIFLVLLTKKDYDTALEILREWKRKEKRKESALGKHKSSKEEIVFQNKGFPFELSDNYAPLEFIGEGGFAKVFKVKRKSDGKIVALKIPRIDEKTSSLFLKEIAAWYHLDHPNIVRLYKADILPVPYLEMEYVEGVSLNGKPVRDLDKYPKPVDEKTALKLVKAIANGLAHAHSKGIWHLDMKPLNVLLKSDLTPKITDWGLAKISSRSSLSTHKGYSPLYAAPEQLDEDLYETPDHRTDIYQLGVIFYELLTGKLPYKGYSPGAVIGKILAENIKALPPSKINPALAKYDGIFEKLLAKRKEDRYQSVGEFLSALDSLEELHKELEELKKTKETLKRSRSKEEIQRLKRETVGKTTKIAILSAKLNDKAELLNALEDLKVYTRENLDDLLNAITQIEVLMKEGIPVSDNLIEKLKVLLHRIEMEVQYRGDV